MDVYKIGTPLAALGVGYADPRSGLGFRRSEEARILNRRLFGGIDSRTAGVLD